MILLDTQVVYWSLIGSNRLGQRTRELIRSAEVRYVSAITHVEFAVKAMRGKLHVPPRLVETIAEAGFDDLPFSERHAAALYDLPSLERHDPFDRMLVAQARAERLAFLTADRLILGLDLPHVIDATN